MDLFFNFVMASCLVLVALCSPDGKNQTFWLFCISCVFVTLSIFYSLLLQQHVILTNRRRASMICKRKKNFKLFLSQKALVLGVSRGRRGTRYPLPTGQSQVL